MPGCSGRPVCLKRLPSLPGPWECGSYCSRCPSCGGGRSGQARDGDASGTSVRSARGNGPGQQTDAGSGVGEDRGGLLQDPTGAVGDSPSTDSGSRMIELLEGVPGSGKSYYAV